jgi:septal ring factor EnvC (AmiA/AmiB activator)
MIQFFLIALLVMAVVAAAAILAAVLQGKRAKKAETKINALHEAFWKVWERAERLQKALGDTAKVEEEADAERTELARTPDSGLADRANSLFGGVRNNGAGRQGSPGNAGPVKAAGTGSAGDGAGSL